MTSARLAIGNYCFKKSKKYILDKCKWLSIENMITYSCLLFIYNINKNNKPKSITNIYRQSKYNRHRSKLNLNTIPKKGKYSKFFLMEHTDTFNDIPTEIKSKSKSIFKREVKIWIQNRPFDTMD